MKKKILDVVTVVLIFFVVLGTIISLVGNKELTSDEYRTYDCDYKSMSLTQTIIETKIDGNPVVIKGGAVSKLWFVDPLVMYDENDNIIANAGDVHGIISQDDHDIYVNGEFDVNMAGHFNLLGESYSLKDKDGNTVGTLQCNMLSTSGYLSDADGDVVAVFESMYGMNDYTVKICDNTVCSDEAMLLVFASYVTDAKHDGENSK